MTVSTADLVAGLVVAALNGYVLLGGADFGGGVWDLLASGPRKAAQRALIAHAIGPIWEANHVWLIVALVLLFTAFPAAFADLAVALHVPLTIMLVGIVLRGSAFTFRTYDDPPSAIQAQWGRVFSVASVLTPLLLGVALGALASEALPAPGSPGTFWTLFVEPWLTAFAAGVGLLTLALFAFLAAVYLTVEAEDAALREDFRRRALGAAVAVFIAAFGVLALAHDTVPRMARVLAGSATAIPVHLATGAAAVVALAALWTRRFRLARVAAAAQASLILWGWAVAQYPYLVPPRLTIAMAAAPQRTLRLLLAVVAAGAVILFPSLAYLFRVFKGAAPRPARS
jgi:cytochrome d ubiquinol oxidase subunit II